MARCPCFFTLAVPNHFRYPVWGQEPSSLMHRHCSVLTQKFTFSPAYYYEVVTNCNALKCHIISAGFSLKYLQIRLFISIYQTEVGIVPLPQTPLSLRMKIFTCSKFGVNHYLNELPGTTYIYLYGRIYASCLS